VSTKSNLAAIALLSVAVLASTSAGASVYTSAATGATATITISGSTLTVDLSSTANNPESDGQTVSGIQVFFNNTITGESGLTQTGRLITIDNVGSATQGAFHDVGTNGSADDTVAHWAVTSSGTTGVDLTTVPGTGSHVIDLIVGQPGTGGIYTTGNKSLLGEPPDRDPYILGTGHFSFTVTGLTDLSSIASVNFNFGTTADEWVAGTTHAAGNTPAVPEPATWAMMLLGFLGVGFMAYRRRSPHMQFRAV
jgi:hypothetical protein